MSWSSTPPLINVFPYVRLELYYMFRIAALLCSLRLLLLMCFPYVRLQLNQTTVAILI